MHRFYENIDIFKKRFHLYFSPIVAYTTICKEDLSDENYINNILTLVIW